MRKKRWTASKLITLTGDIVAFDLIEGDDDRLMAKRQDPTRGPWPALIRKFQDGRRVERGKPFCKIETEHVKKAVEWWMNGSGGAPGKGGWEEMIPMRSLRQYLTEEFHAAVSPLLAVVDDRNDSERDNLSFEPLTSSEAAAKLGISVTTVHALRKRGVLVARRTTTGIFLFDLANVEAYKKATPLQKHRLTRSFVH